MSVLRVEGHHLPQIARELLGAPVSLRFARGDVRLEVEFPALAAAAMPEIGARLEEMQRNHLGTRPVREIIAVCEEAARRWLDPAYPLRRTACELVPITSGLSPEMVARCIDDVMRALAAGGAQRMVTVELGDPTHLDGFVSGTGSGSRSKAYAPPVVAHVFAGNAPALPALSIVAGLLVKSACLAKVSQQEPLFATLFARSIAELDPVIGRTIAVTYWDSGSAETTRAAFSAAGAVVVYGGEESVRAMRRLAPEDGRFVAFTHKISFGVVGREVLSAGTVREVAHAVATDASMYDQQGCFCPHMVYVEEGGAISPREFAELVAEAMAAANAVLPRGAIPASAAYAIHRVRSEFELREISGKSARAYCSPRGTDWTVLYDDRPEFVPSCLNRVLRVTPIASVDEVAERVAPIRRYLQTVGVALPPARAEQLADALGRLGASRVAPLGRMVTPSVEWHHDGRFNLLDLVRWTDMDA